MKSITNANRPPSILRGFRGFKIWKLTALFLSLCAILALSFACSSGSATSTVKTQVATVQKGDLAVTVTGTGNLSLARSEDLAFEIAGTVSQVLVAESDSVTAGQELARLDTSEWDKQIQTLNKALETAQRTESDQETALVKAQRQIAAKELAVQQAELDVKAAENNLKQNQNVKEAQDKIDTLNSNLTFAKQMQQGSVNGSVPGGDVNYWNTQIKDLTQQLTEAQKALQAILDETSVDLTADEALAVTNAQFQIVQKQKALEDAQTAVEDAKADVEKAQQTLGDAQQAVKEAQSDLEEAQSQSPLIKAPFDGFITKVNVKGGDEITKGTVALQIADPNQFEAVTLVTEKDIFSVKVGGEATVSLEALSGISFPAKVTAVAPTATVSSGVVNYKVTVQLTSLTPVGSTASTAASKTTQPAGPTPSVSLKDGLSAVVDILIQSKSGVLMVPSRAITRQGQNSVVQVVKGTATETRTVKTGLSDEQNTEITEGLSEGEQVVITLGSTSSSSSTSNSAPQGVGGFGGPGGIMP